MALPLSVAVPLPVTVPLPVAVCRCLSLYRCLLLCCQGTGPLLVAPVLLLCRLDRGPIGPWPAAAFGHLRSALCLCGGSWVGQAALCAPASWQCCRHQVVMRYNDYKNDPYSFDGSVQNPA